MIWTETLSLEDVKVMHQSAAGRARSTTGALKTKSHSVRVSCQRQLWHHISTMPVRPALTLIHSPRCHYDRHITSVSWHECKITVWTKEHIYSL